MTYTVTVSNFDKIVKKFNWFKNKCKNMNMECSLTETKRYFKSVPVKAADPVTNTIVKIGESVIEVVEFELVIPEYKLGDYTVVAILEHGDDVNIVHGVSNNIPVPIMYRTNKGYCEHCNINRYRRKTAVLVGSDGYFKQVGIACLKEYTGIDANNIVKFTESIDEIVCNDEVVTGLDSCDSRVNNDFVNIIEYLTKCIHLIRKNGYIKGVTKYEAEDSVKIEDTTDDDKELANKVYDFFTTVVTSWDEFGDFAWNVHTTMINNTHCKRYNGYVAYAYTAYLNELERIRKEKERISEIENQKYFGNPKDKFTNIECIGTYTASYDTMYGFTRIYKFVDKDNHVFVWKTSSCVDGMPYKESVKCVISGTVKEHNEYNDEKQTVILRTKVKVMEVV